MALVTVVEFCFSTLGKPAMVYALTPAADTLLPKAYAPVMGVLLDTLGERLGPDALAELLREVGRRAAAGRVGQGDDVRMRIEAAYGVLGESAALPVSHPAR
jgi:predicted ArsR family transcriptional regulator